MEGENGKRKEREYEEDEQGVVYHVDRNFLNKYETQKCGICGKLMKLNWSVRKQKLLYSCRTHTCENLNKKFDFDKVHKKYIEEDDELDYLLSKGYVHKRR